MFCDATEAAAPDRKCRATTLVIGLGNPILGDDGVGWAVAEEVVRRIGDGHQAVEVDCVALGGLNLMERMVGYDRVVLVDAIVTGRQPTGTTTSFPLHDLPGNAAGHTASAHDACLKTALAMGHAMGAPLPKAITVVAVESRHVNTFSDRLSPEVAAAVPVAASLVMDALRSA